MQSPFSKIMLSKVKDYFQDLRMFHLYFPCFDITSPLVLVLFILFESHCYYFLFYIVFFTIRLMHGYFYGNGILE